MDIAERRETYVRWIAGHFGAIASDMEAGDGRQWALAHARLRLGDGLAEANRHLVSFALTKDSDICFIRYLKTYLDFRESERLSAAAKEHIQGVLESWPSTELTSVARWPTHHTENHDLMQMTIGMFAEEQRGRSMSDHVREIKKSLVWRFQRGWIEWNSPCYQFHYSNPLILLVDHAPTEDLRRSARDLLNLMLAERALLGVNGYLGGPAFRCRTADANNSPTARKVAYLQDNRYDGFLPSVWLAFGLGEPRFDFDKARVEGLEPATTEYASANEPRLKQDEGMFMACSSFVPHPVVIALAEEGRTRRSLVYEGRRYLGWPRWDVLWETQKWLPASVHYFNTPHISMGSLHSSGWVCQSRYSNVMFPADPSQNLRIEMILPGVLPHKRRYESRGRVVQHKNWMLGQGTPFEDGGLKPNPVGDWDLYRVGKGLCAHAMLPDSYHVLQASDLDTYATEAGFAEALSMPSMANEWVHAVTTDGDRVAVNTGDMSITVNGTPRPHPPKMLHDCEAMRSVYGSGRIAITTRKGSVTFDAGASEE